jgi:hypothetical protein
MSQKTIVVRKYITDDNQVFECLKDAVQHSKTSSGKMRVDEYIVFVDDTDKLIVPASMEGCKYHGCRITDCP